jgi:hypothetical protein
MNSAGGAVTRAQPENVALMRAWLWPATMRRTEGAVSPGSMAAQGAGYAAAVRLSAAHCRRQALGLMPTKRRNNREKCAWSHRPQASAI